MSWVHLHVHNNYDRFRIIYSMLALKHQMAAPLKPHIGNVLSCHQGLRTLLVLHVNSALVE